MNRIHIVSRDILIPAAIIVAGLIIAIAVYVERTAHPTAVFKGDPDTVRPVTPEDHTIGPPDAPVKIVEYADIDSKFSKEFQATMEQLMTEYLPGEKVVWVYRHFPAADGYINAETHAEAAECVASLGKPSNFFLFIDNIAALSPGTDQFNPADYPQIISQLGIDQNAFATCLASGKFAKRIGDDAKNALDAGATGAPYTVVLIKGADSIPISGAIPYASMKKVIDQAIASIKE